MEPCTAFAVSSVLYISLLFCSTSLSHSRTYIDAHSATDQSCLTENHWPFINHKVTDASSKGITCGQAECQESFCEEVKNTISHKLFTSDITISKCKYMLGMALTRI